MTMPQFRRPSAYIPIAMSVAALSLVLAHIARYGRGREADEGAAAHTFQLLMLLQIPVIGWFAVRWLPKERARGAGVLVAQAVAAGAAFAALYWLEH